MDNAKTECLLIPVSKQVHLYSMPSVNVYETCLLLYSHSNSQSLNLRSNCS